MLKQPKTILKLFAICLLIGLNSCTNDLYEDSLQNKHNDIKITEKSFEELMVDNKFKGSYNKVWKNKDGGSNLKTIMEANNNFTISDLPAKVIETNNKISYTFHITRNFIDPDYFENLIIGIDSLNQTKAYIAKYKIDNDHKALINKTPFKSVTYKSILYNKNLTARVTDCVSFQLSRCNGSPYDCGGSICGFETFTACSGSGGGSGGDYSNGTASWGGGGTSGTTTTPIVGGAIDFSSFTNAQKFYYSFSRSGLERDFLNAMSTEASTLLANYVNSNTYPSQSSADARNFVLALTRNSEWFTFQSVETQTSIFNYVISNKFSVSSTNFANQMIALAIANNSTFSFDSSVNATNAMSFNSVTDFQNFLNQNQGISQNLSQITLANLSNNYIGNYKFGIGVLGGINLEVKYSSNNSGSFSVANVSSSQYGTLFSTWTQSSYTSNFNNTNNTTRIDVYGDLGYDITLGGIGIRSHNHYHLVLVVDNTSSGVISSSWSHF